MSALVVAVTTTNKYTHTREHTLTHAFMPRRVCCEPLQQTVFGHVCFVLVFSGRKYLIVGGRERARVFNIIRISCFLCSYVNTVSANETRCSVGAVFFSSTCCDRFDECFAFYRFVFLCSVVSQYLVIQKDFGSY